MKFCGALTVRDFKIELISDFFTFRRIETRYISKYLQMSTIPSVVLLLVSLIFYLVTITIILILLKHKFISDNGPLKT